MTLAATAQLITATLDLQLIRLVRAAMNADGHGPGGAQIRPRQRIEPEPRFEPRPVVHPTPRFEPRPVIEPAPRFDTGPVRAPEVCEPSLASVYGPLPAPWQTLIRQRVWEMPVQRPVMFKPNPLPAEITVAGRILDQFV